MMSNSIPLSPKHGLNPTIPVCAWCGESKNEIALMGRIKTDVRGEDPQAPMYCVLDYQPCEKCRQQWSQGVPVIEATTVRPEPYRPPIQSVKGSPDVYPTMRMVVVTVEAAQRIFSNVECKAGSPILVEDKAFEQIFGEALRKQGENND